MKRSVSIVVLCLFLLVAGFAFAQEISFLNPGPSGAVPPVPASPVAQSPEYTPILLASGHTGIRGLGVPGPAGRIFVTTAYGYLYLYQNGSMQNTGMGLGGFSGHYFQGYYWGDKDGSIYRLVNGKVTHLATLPGMPSLIDALTVDPANGSVYFSAGNSVFNGIYVLRKGSSTPKLLLSLPIPNPSYGLAINGDLLYFGDYYGGAIYRIPKRGGRVRLVCSGLAQPARMVFDKGGNLYIAEFGGGRILAVKAGTTDPTVIALSAFIGAVAVDGNGNVYFGTNAGQLWKLQRSFN